MIVVNREDEISPFSAYLKEVGKTIGFVPTMGALHEGHMSLIRRSKEENDVTIVSIFVNPKQFGPNEDFDRYPRPIEEDLALLKSLKVDVAFCPTVEDMYPPTLDMETLHYPVPEMATWYCGVTRPQFFQGVCTVVRRLFNLVAPHSAYFGEKDYQQLTVINHMVRDLSLPIRIVGCPILREDIGLAMSSRNRYLTPEEQISAASIYSAFLQVRMAWLGNYQASEDLLLIFYGSLAETIKPEYGAIVDPHTLEPQDIARPNDRLLFAGQLGSTRLIDNFSF